MVKKLVNRRELICESQNLTCWIGDGTRYEGTFNKFDNKLEQTGNYPDLSTNSTNKRLLQLAPL